MSLRNTVVFSEVINITERSKLLVVRDLEGEINIFMIKINIGPRLCKKCSLRSVCESSVTLCKMINERKILKNGKRVSYIEWVSTLALFLVSYLKKYSIYER